MLATGPQIERQKECEKICQKESQTDRMLEEMPERMSEDFLQSVCEVESNRTHLTKQWDLALKGLVLLAEIHKEGDANVAALKCHGGDHLK